MQCAGKKLSLKICPPLSSAIVDTCIILGDGRKWGQSPIDIDENNAIGIKFPALIMSGHWNQDGKVKMRNNGTTGEPISLSRIYSNRRSNF